MPLPKAPTELASTLEDYGPQVTTPLPAAKATRKKKKVALPSDDAPSATTPARRTRQRVAATEANESAERSTTHAPEVAPKTKAKRKVTQATPAATASTKATRPALSPSTPTPNNTLRRGRASVPAHLPKLFVLDTNVLMHDPNSLFRFAEHDVFIPMVTLEELDNHKKGFSDAERNARAASRFLDQLLEAHQGSLDEPVPLHLLGHKEATGRLWFETQPLRAAVPETLSQHKGDNLILMTAKALQMAQQQTRAVILVTKDINMRLKAYTLGIPAEDYFNDKVIDDTDLLFSGVITLPSDYLTRYATQFDTTSVNSAILKLKKKAPMPFVLNAFVCLEGDEAFLYRVARIDDRTVFLEGLKPTSKGNVWGIHPKNLEQRLALELLMDDNIDFVTLLGQAGTGKTLLTLAAALEQTFNRQRYSEIILTRATVSVGEEIGFLPGTEEEKMEPWMGALEDNLEVLHQQAGQNSSFAKKATQDHLMSRIRIKSMNFMRGRTFMKKFVIIDEAQNMTPKQMKTLITRAGEGTKIVCLGNLAQIDTPYLTEGSSGLTYVVEHFMSWGHAATLTLTRGERSRLADFANEAL